MTKPSYQITNVPFTAVSISDDFWTPRIEANRTVTVPYDFQKCEETGRIRNFDIAAGVADGEHEGIYFNDSDVFKIIEGAAYSLHLHPDPQLESYLDDLIARIAAAQEEDGYLYTARTIAERNDTVDQLDAERVGHTRWSQLRMNHELYNVGHLYEAAVAHYHATGKRTLLDVALKNADLIDSVFGPEGVRDVPGHQEIELGLVKLYSVTGDERYLRLARFFLDERGHARGRELYAAYEQPGYMQDHQPVTEQREAVGHAVRAVYMYCAMADVAALTGEQAYIDAIDALWENVVGKKMYLTGGLGARHHGESFGENYELPNDTAYTETCAAIASIFWNQRMFQLHGHAKYIDVLELALYNGFLSGISFSGDRFFYSNPLSFDGEYEFNRDNSKTRQPWFSCSCCPSNVVRVFPALGGYIYAQRQSEQGAQLFVNLFITSEATLEMAGQPVRISQQTSYPWDGNTFLRVELDEPTEFTLCVRVPGWTQAGPVPGDLYRYAEEETVAVSLRVNGEDAVLHVKDGYARITRTWHDDDDVELHLDIPIRRVVSHGAVEADQGRVAIMRGPLVYCVEGVDNGGRALDLALSDSADLRAEPDPKLLGGVARIHAVQPGADPGELMAVPYYAWAHRGVGEMAVWLQREA